MKSVFPTLEKDGVTATLGTPTREAVWAMLSAEVEEDAGTGSGAYDIQMLAEVYCGLADFIQWEMWDAMDDFMFWGAHEDLHKGFLAANTAESAPSLTPADPPEPGSYNRGIISEGQYREVAADQDNTALVNDGGTGEDTPAPGDFSRGFLTDGHARPGAIGEASEPDVTKGTLVKDRTFYTNEQKDAAQAAMQTLHDHMVTVFGTDLCPMGGEGADAEPASEGKATNTLDTSGTGELKSVDAPEATEPVPTAGKAAEPDLLKGVSAEITKAVGAAMVPFQTRITELEGTIRQLSAEPDPAKAPLRGTAGVVGGEAHKVAHSLPPDPAEAEAAQDNAAMVRHYEKVALYSDDGEMRQVAMRKLREIKGGALRVPEPAAV